LALLAARYTIPLERKIDMRQAMVLILTDVEEDAATLAAVLAKSTVSRLRDEFVVVCLGKRTNRKLLVQDAQKNLAALAQPLTTPSRTDVTTTNSPAQGRQSSRLRPAKVRKRTDLVPHQAR
jgi:hypothetical protein